MISSSVSIIISIIISILRAGGRGRTGRASPSLTFLNMEQFLVVVY